MFSMFIVIFYLVVIFIIGIFTSKMVKDRAGFFVASRRLGILTTTSSLTATSIGGSATIAASIYVYTKGLPGMWMNLSAGIGLILLGITFAGKVREMNVFSLPEMIQIMYSRRVRICASILVVIAEIAWLALLIQAMQIFINSISGINPVTAIYISTFIIIAYTVLGGQFGVSYSDILQMFIMFFGILLMVGMVITKAKFFSVINSIPPSMLTFPVGVHMGIIDLIALFFLMGLPHMVGSDIYAKVLSAKDVKTARMACLLSGLLRIFWGGAITIISLGALILMPDLENPSIILPEMILRLFNPYISGIMVAAFLAAMMSSADTVVLTGATVLSNDIFSFSEKNKSNLLIIRLLVLCIGIMGLFLALYLRDIIKTLELAYTVFASGLIIPFIAGFYKEKLRVDEKGALASMVGGGGLALLMKLRVVKIFPAVDPVLIGMGAGTVLLFFPVIFSRR